MIGPDFLARVQQSLRDLQLDAWLFFDHHHRDPIAYQILGLPPNLSPSRRWHYLIPREGEPQALVHRIEPRALDPLPGHRHLYSGWRSHQEGLASLLFGLKRVAMQYSPGCAIPYVSLVDGGTIELIRSFDVEIVSSADLIQIFHATLSPAQIESHLEAGRRMDAIRREAFQFASQSLSSSPLDEWQLHLWLRSAFEREGLITDHGPIVAINAHAADPHYEPTLASSLPIRPGDLLLIDMWAKLNQPASIFYDITWTAYCGSAVPTEVENVFHIVRGARDAAFALVESTLSSGLPLHGFEVDDAARSHIDAHGYGHAFVHRTGHSITSNVHGTGANMDNLETHDERLILPNTLFSIEPGVYLDQFGIRSEFNVLTGHNSARTTGEVQHSLLRL
ncbi:MAG: M24 family metallopeptidase [Acidobacteriota bacterium]